MSGISTHILDTANGRPASGIRVQLFHEGREIGSSVTGPEGRISSLAPAGFVLDSGMYRMLFHIGAYFPEGFYSEVTVSFLVRDPGAHYHVPLLISPFGYTTYRGS